jgi:hypothetical protein
MILVTRSDEYLKHHGILGQKWGKKNGPPYPIDASDHSSSEKKAGWRKSLDKDSSTEDNKRKGLSDKQKKAIKIGAAVAVTALATYGAYRLVKSGKLDKYIDIGKIKADSLLKKKAGDSKVGDIKVDDLLNNASTAKTNPSVNNIRMVHGVKKLAKPESLSDIIKNVNPNLGNNDYRNNCSACGIASFLRSKGYDVTAKSTGGKQQILGGVIEECFKGVKVMDGSAVKFGRSRQDAAEMLVNKFGNNASGVVSVQWKKELTRNGQGGGHIFNWEIKDGVVKFFDGQNNRDDSVVSSLYWRMMNPNDSLTIARLDNAEINFDAIKKYVENR